MPEYIYGCDEKDHPRETLVHGMTDIVETYCTVCGRRLHRIPQPFLFGFSPIEILRDWCEGNWSKKLRGEPREEYNVCNPGRGIPQKDYKARK